MSALEKAARAVFDSEYPSLTLDEALDIARAVLMAVREVQESVSDTGWEAMAGSQSSWSFSISERPQNDAFTAMIDAILSEPQP